MSYTLYYDGINYTSADILKNWSVAYGTAANPSVNSTAGRHGGGAIYLAPNTWSYENGWLSSISFTPSHYFVLGFALKFTGTGLSWYLRSGSTSEISVSIDSINRLVVNGVTSTKSLTSNQYSFIEIGTFHNNSGTFEVRVNGSSVGWIPLTNADTLTVAGGIDNFHFNMASNISTAYICDLYCTYGNELKYFGDSRIDKLALTANSSPQEWTANSGLAWERLNAGDGYVSSNVDEATSYFTVADLSFDPTVIHAIQVKGKARKSDAGQREIAFLTKSNSVEAESNNMVLSTSDLYFYNVLETDPSTNTAWTANGINNMEIGMRVKV